MVYEHFVLLTYSKISSPTPTPPPPGAKALEINDPPKWLSKESMVHKCFSLPKGF